MSRIPYPVVEKLPDDVRKIVEHANLNALRMFAHATPQAEHLLNVYLPLARDVGLSKAALGAIEQGNSPPGVLTPAQHAVLVFADEVIRDANASDAALAGVRRHLDDNQLMDLMMVIGIYVMLSRLILTSGAEVDAHSMGTSYLDKLHN